MAKGFSFDGALMFPYRAAHLGSFLWKYALAFALVGSALTALFLYLVRDVLFGIFDAVEQLESSGTDDLDLIFDTLLRSLGPLVPWLVLSILVSWVVWAMFATASQRRYIRNEDFHLAFGADELRMMGAGAIWYTAQSLVSIVPLVVMAPVFTSIFAVERGDISEDAFFSLMFSRMGILLLLMLLFLPFYIFFATRFSPIFAITVKERKIDFAGAWIASRGRFWQILGAYFIISIVGGMVVGFIASLAQMVLMPAMMNNPVLMQDVPDIRAMFTPAMIIAMMIYLFIRYFASGLLMHVVDGPAAFAARHDPRGGIDDAEQIATFD